jgi:hypothetical protein
MAEYHYVTDGRPDGAMIGQTATTDKVGFFATTPVVQPTDSNQAAVTTTITTTLATNTVLETDLAATIVLANELRTALVALGIIKGS